MSAFASSRCSSSSLRTICVAISCLGIAQTVNAHELTLQADMRAVVVDSPLASFTEGGLGVLRFDEEHDGLQLGRLLIDVAGPLAETIHYTVTASATDDGDQNAIDLTEAYVDWRPYPQSEWRWRTRGGAFYAPISLENRAIGWQSLYSLSPSSINTWVGEEMRTIGLEVASTSLGRPAARSFDVTFVAAAYGWNDPMGVLILQRGWGIHDRQTPLFGSLPRPLVRDPNNRTLEFFDEIDDRIGYYVGAEIKWRNDSLVRLLRYDNLGDPDDATAKEPAWRTKFDSMGVRLELPFEISLLTQLMLGETEAGPQGNGRGQFLLEYWAYYLLASQKSGSHRYTLRYDRLYTDLERGAGALRSEQNAIAWTAAYLYDLNDHWQFALEGIRISGSLAQRALVGQPVSAVERQLQLAVRYTF